MCLEPYQEQADLGLVSLAVSLPVYPNDSQMLNLDKEKGSPLNEEFRFDFALLLVGVEIWLSEYWKQPGQFWQS